MEHGVRKTLNPSLSVEDRELCENVATVFIEHGKLWERLQNVAKARISFQKAEKWSTSTLISGQQHPRDNNKVVRRIALIAPEIFTHDVVVRPFKPKLPAPDARIGSTPQLVYCLTLLSNITPSPHTVTAMNEILDENDRNWLRTMAEDADEQAHLRSLTGKLIAEFINDDLKETAAVAEVVSLAPVLTQAHYRTLLNSFIDSFNKAKLLEFGLLDGLAQLIQNVQGGHLLPSDLVSMLAC
ncbi:hypothetical protein BGZ68_000688 [Mortierella alpina]|nr:hypothetical protein BGZ68_000688 [Mortierella alpina]